MPFIALLAMAAIIGPRPITRAIVLEETQGYKTFTKVYDNLLIVIGIIVPMMLLAYLAVTQIL